MLDEDNDARLRLARAYAKYGMLAVEDRKYLELPTFKKALVINGGSVTAAKEASQPQMMIKNLFSEIGLLKVIDDFSDTYVYVVGYDDVDEEGDHFGGDAIVTLTLKKALDYKKKLERGEEILGIDSSGESMPLPSYKWHIKRVPVTGVKYLNEETLLQAEVRDDEPRYYYVTGFSLYDPQDINSICLELDHYYADGMDGP
jgi:hypothetical protein